MIRRTLRLRREEGGYTGLIELLVVLLLLGLILGTVYSSVYSTQDTVLGTQERLRNLDEGRTIMAVLTKDVRTAVRLQSGTSPFVLGNGNEVIFYANLNTIDAPKKVRIYIDAQSRLVEQVWDGAGTKPNYTYPGTAKTRLVGRFVANTTALPIFEYFDANNVKLTTPVSAAGLLAINNIKITLRIKRANGQEVATTTLINRVRLPNQDYDAVAGG